jgi:hypothetical protein
MKFYLTGKEKDDDFNNLYYLIPWRNNYKSIEENKKRWNDFYSKVKELKAKRIIANTNDDFFNEEAEKQLVILDKLKSEIIGYDDYYIEGEEGNFYSNKYDETKWRLKNE